MSDLIISMVKCASDTETRDVRLHDVLRGIRTGGRSLLGQITQIRRRFQAELAKNGGDLKAARVAVDPLKKALPGVMWCGQFSNREQPAADKLQKHSGLSIADLDGLGDKLREIRKKLEASPYVFAFFLSPTGNGLKVVIRVPTDASKHAGCFRAVEAHIKQLTGIQIDQSGKDVSRLCFMSYDAGLYHNPNATELEPLPEPEKPRAVFFNSSGAVNLSERQRIATELLGGIDWQSGTSGFCVCPGKHLHTTGDGERDCKIELDGAPTAHCFHDHCRGILEGVNHELRSLIGKAEFVPTADDETIARLAALSPIDYDRLRKDEAKKLGCRESTLDLLVNAKRLLMRSSSDGDNLQGIAVKLADVEPWPEPVNGEILDAIAKRFEHYVVLPEGAADMLALWCAHTHVFKLFQISPRLNISAPTQECGKTTLRNCTSLFCARAKRTDNMTTAVMFRLVSGHSPTILADECDKWLFTNEELLGLVQSGHEKGGAIMRCEGDSNDLREFGCYAPFAMAAIGALPSQLHSRSICIRLERAKREEIKKRSRLDLEHVEYETELNRKLARWTTDNRERIQSCDPKLPEHLFNRISDNWRPLFAIAEVAGGDWPRRCASALLKLTTREDDRESLRVMLLADIQQVFTSDRIFSKDLVELLAQMSERPWPEICRGRPINERWLARNLADFGIHSKTLRIGEERAKGYELSDFGEAFDRYLPVQGDFIRDSVTYEGKPVFSSVTKLEHVTDTKNDSLIGKKGICHGVTLEKRGSPEKEGLEEPAPAAAAVEDTEGEL